MNHRLEWLCGGSSKIQQPEYKKESSLTIIWKKAKKKTRVLKTNESKVTEDVSCTTFSVDPGLPLRIKKQTSGDKKTTYDFETETPREKKHGRPGHSKTTMRSISSNTDVKLDRSRHELQVTTTTETRTDISRSRRPRGA